MISGQGCRSYTLNVQATGLLCFGPSFAEPSSRGLRRKWGGYTGPKRDNPRDRSPGVLSALENRKLHSNGMLSSLAAADTPRPPGFVHGQVNHWPRRVRPSLGSALSEDWRSRCGARIPG
jgi:hypothetical protein